MKIKIALLTLMGLILLSSSLLAQEKELNKAEKLFKNYNYNAAIPYFEYYLENEERKKVVSIKTKLAYCYRMSNKTSEAEKLYAELVQEERVRPIIFMYYGEMLMANGKYPEAKDWFLKYQELKPDDENVLLLIEACNNVNTITPLFNITLVKPLELNSEADEFSPVFYEDGIAFLSDQGEKGRTYGWTGRSFLKLYKSEKNETGKFEDFQEFSKRINIFEKNTGPVSITRDGNTMIVTRNSDVPSKSNRYNLQLFEVDSRNGKWGRGKVMEFCTPEQNYMHPAFSPTGDTLYFVSDKAGSVGGTDIFMTYRTPKGWKRPTNLGEVVNTTGHEAFPFVHADGTLYFASKGGHSGFGGFDLFKAERDSYGEFNKVINLGEPINGARDDTGFILADDKKSGYFASSRMSGNDDIYYFETIDVAMKGEELAMAAIPDSYNTNKSVDFSNKTTLKAYVVNASNQDRLTNVTIILKDKAGNEINTFEDEKGQITGVLNKNTEYSIELKKDGFQTTIVPILTNDKNKLSMTFNMEQ